MISSETASDLMHITDRNGDFIYVNEAMADVLRYSKEEMLGMHISQILDDGDWSVFERKSEQLASKEGIILEPTWIAQDGRRIQGEMRVVAVYDRSGNFSGTRGVFRDITERKLLEEDLQLVAQGFSAISGEMFFQHLVTHLAKTLTADCVSVAMLPPGVRDRVRTIAVTEGTTIIENFEYHLAGTPCDHVLDKHECIYPNSVQAAFPNDEMLVVMGIEAYAALPLLDSTGTTLGLLSVLFKEPIGLTFVDKGRACPGAAGVVPTGTDDKLTQLVSIKIEVSDAAPKIMPVIFSFHSPTNIVI